MAITAQNMQETSLLLRNLSEPTGHFGALVELSKIALDRGDIEEALRLSDRAVRLSENNYLVRILRGTILLKAGRPEQSIEHFTKSIALGGSPEGEIGLAHAYLEMGEFQSANIQAGLLANRFAGGDLSMITPLLRRVCNALGEQGVGWVSITADGYLVGAIAKTRSADRGILVAVTMPDGKILVEEKAKSITACTEPEAIADGFVTFAFPLEAVDCANAVQVRLDGIDLIGSPARAPSASQIEGFVDRSGDRIMGWVTLAGHPKASLGVRLIDQAGKIREFLADSGSIAEAAADGGTHAAVRQHFEIDLAQIGLESSRVEIWGWIPALDLGSQLAGSPLGGQASRPSAKSPVLSVDSERGRVNPAKLPVDVIVPVYGGAIETSACLESILATADNSDGASPRFELVVVDDGNPDGELRRMLDGFAADGKITLLRNQRNIGFPASVNLGFDLHSDRDVVVLNSDTVIFPGWLARLREAAYSSPDIGTVTPFSNEASILSYPKSLGDNDEPTSDEGRALDRLAGDVNAGLVIDIPTAVGFCMYVRRGCLDDVGVFDIISFGRGYGEENDFCMRASEAGWRNIAAPNIFVKHVGGRSFGASKRALVVRNTRILNGLHPGYDRLVREFIEADPLAEARRNIDAARLRRVAGRPVILLITLGLGGGVARNVREAAERYKARGLKALILRPRKEEGDLTGRTVLSDPFDETLCNLVFDLPTEMHGLLSLLADCNVGKVEIHHFLGQDPSVFEIAGHLRVPYEVVLHDYSWLCPRSNLVDARGRFCGLPQDAQICERCVAIDGASLLEIMPVADLRRRSAKVLSDARRVIAGCNDVVSRFRPFAPSAAYEVQPWEEQAPFASKAPRMSGGRLRVAVIGGIGEQKGYDILLACARDAALRDLPIEFVVVGFTSDDFDLFKTGRVFVTGKYKDEESVKLVQEQNCDLAFLPSISPETWSYTLSLAWKAGLEVLAFDFGAIAERIRASGYGRVIPISSDETAVNAAILKYGMLLTADSADDVERAVLDVVSRDNDDSTLVKLILLAEDDERLVVENAVPLEPGLYAFSLKTSGEGEVPLVQISTTASAAAGGKVDFLGTHDPVETWLTRDGDVVAVRVSRAPSSLSIKSLRRPGKLAAAISVECRRLDRGTEIDDPTAAPNETGSLRVQITAHIQNKGDVPFFEAGWVGCIDEHLWIEAFTINPLKGLLPEEIEYKALTATGFETPWLPGGVICGTRGTSNPLIAFAIRLRGAAADRYECRYRGSFRGAGVAGPARDGGACKSVYGRDPLEGIELEIVERTVAAVSEDQETVEDFVPEYEIVYGSN